MPKKKKKGGGGGGGGDAAASNHHHHHHQHLHLGSSVEDQKSMAAFLLSSVAFQSPEQAAAVAGLGAIPPLVAMLSSPSPQQHKAAACTLSELLHENEAGCRTFVHDLSLIHI